MMTSQEEIRFHSPGAGAGAGASFGEDVRRVSGELASHSTAVLFCFLLLTTIGAAVVRLYLQSRVLDSLRTVTRTLQEGLLRPLPGRVGGLRTEVRYLAAHREARIGGDIYDVACTPFGVRLLIGDVMGSGMPAVGTALDTLGAYRELVQCEARLTVVAQRMDAALARREHCEDFVTALLLGTNGDDGELELVCCGHPPPLLIRGRHATFVDPLPPSPPLGLIRLENEWCRSSTMSLAAGDRLLLYTDGVTEARSGGGEFYPLAERAVALYDRDPGTFLDAISADLIRHVKGRPKDDAALLLVDYGDIRAEDGQFRSHSPRLSRGSRAARIPGIDEYRTRSDLRETR
ncbi:serine/threonine-protein phosphatase [Streptomyces sp. NBC_00006]|uniref:PP2C family protein-serine/threonine phosphatase n=1 Tax=Streptomyces sp. NBC_00006 TaxID=2975619 RepID=UPI00224E91D3|nr:PP2C family protein-serine/threonine phosphatase [Streptomyces sp. NBC_00006]MCX5531131.1 serine/threonine-protein phosphatase [Streptomyces sp. NBC_00006]